MTLWCLEVGPVANAREGSMQEYDWAKVHVLMQHADVKPVIITYVLTFFIKLQVCLQVSYINQSREMIIYLPGYIRMVISP